MLILGLTGSIGMGKSLTLAALRRLVPGLAFYDADAAVHLLYRHPAVIEAIRQAFPAAYQNGRINRGVLADIVFNDRAAKKTLEKIIYPRLALLEQNSVMQAARRRAPLMVLDIPLLFETGAERRVDASLVVNAPAFVQQARVLARTGMNNQRFLHIKAAQMSDTEKRKRADFVVPTGLGRAHTTRCLQKLLQQLKVQPPKRHRWTALFYTKEFYARNRS